MFADLTEAEANNMKGFNATGVQPDPEEGELLEENPEFNLGSNYHGVS